MVMHEKLCLSAKSCLQGNCVTEDVATLTYYNKCQIAQQVFGFKINTLESFFLTIAHKIEQVLFFSYILLVSLCNWLLVCIKTRIKAVRAAVGRITLPLESS
jgi:hypothetical protein